MRTGPTTLCALLMLLLAAPCSAIDHLVYVDDGSFTPKVVTINLGDTITFKELGTQGAHNVHAPGAISPRAAPRRPAACTQ